MALASLWRRAEMKEDAMRIAGAIGLAAALSTLAVVQVRAETYTSETDAQRRTVVRIGDLNLATPTGASTLRTRLQSAAEKVCGPRPQNPLDLAAAGQFRGCVSETFERAMAAAPPGAQQVAVRRADILR
jgi:UrcA family protein